MNRLRCTAFVCLALVSGAAASGGGDGSQYDITLHRPAWVGQKLHLKGDGVLERRVVAVRNGAEQPAQLSTLRIRFDADATVMAVDDKGRPTRVSYAIQECTSTQDNVTTVVGPTGSTMTARRDGETTIFEIDGRPVGPVANEALQLVARFEGDGATEDELAGSSRPRGVGERWSIDVDATARQLGRQTGQAMRRADLSGATTLVEVTEHNGETCLALYTELVTENVVPGLRDLPAGFELREGGMTATAHRLMPVNDRLPSLVDFRQMDAEAVLTAATGPQQPFSEMRFSVTQFIEIERTPLASDRSLSTVTEGTSAD